jgi:acetylornithine deacetylase/succinyl-diaminopimelate desuccinylase-like protein
VVEGRLDPMLANKVGDLDMEKEILNEASKTVIESLDESLKTEIVEMVADLVNISSPTGEEKEIANYVHKRFSDLTTETEFQEVEPGRDNVIATLKGSGGGKNLYFNAHFDTSTTGKEKNFPDGHKAKAKIIDNWIYGLGVSNMKNAFAGYYGALRMIQKAGIKLKGNVIVGGVVGEIEKAPIDQFQGKDFRGGGLGTMHMMMHGVTADYCICGEPTGLRLQPGNTGYIFCKITTAGSAQHTWSKQNGVDAIEKMQMVIILLRKWEIDFEKNHPHPFMKTRVGISAIQGGYPYKPSICPAPFCYLYIDIRTLPNQSVAAVKRELDNVLNSIKSEDPEFNFSTEFYLVRNGYELPLDHELVTLISANHKNICNSEIIFPEPYRYAVSADTSIVHGFGIPGITYGAGGITRKGTYSMYDENGECLGVDNLMTATKVYALSILRICGFSG